MIFDVFRMWDLGIWSFITHVFVFLVRFWVFFALSRLYIIPSKETVILEGSLAGVCVVIKK